MPIPRSRDMSFDPKTFLRTVTMTGEKSPGPVEAAPAPPADSLGVNTVTELVADLLAATELLAPDRLAAARGRAGGGSLAQALLDEGHAKPEGIARARARRLGLPVVDLNETRVSPDAAKLIELRVLKRVVAIPFAL